jgi:hypothetical protein
VPIPPGTKYPIELLINIVFKTSGNLTEILEYLRSFVHRIAIKNLMAIITVNEIRIQLISILDHISEITSKSIFLRMIHSKKAVIMILRNALLNKFDILPD